ncbi:MAG: hypothetical protein M3Q49_17340 [Actinomycetota bacterium]|nr:hypothetical protein [Actinomycetota bacterium]
MAGQQENAPDRLRPERYYSEYIRLPADDNGRASLIFLRGVFDERSRRGWKLVSASKEPSGDALLLLLEWDTLAPFSDRALDRIV